MFELPEPRQEAGLRATQFYTTIPIIGGYGLRKKTRANAIRLGILLFVLVICASVVALALRGALPNEELNRHQSLISFLATIFGLVSAFLVFTKDVFPNWHLRMLRQ